MKWRARIFPKRLIIAAACARPFVGAAARAGYEVIALDAFCDEEVNLHATQAIRLRYVDGGFDADELLRTLRHFHGENFGFVYGSGFETQPELLANIAQDFRLLGNDAETVRTTKDPDRFFSLLPRCGIPFPETVATRPVNGTAWLAKRIGGSGGTHVLPGPHVPRENCYWQRTLPGQPCSLLFLADGQQVRPIGYNLQFLAPTPGMPFRYGGAVSHAEILPSLRAAMLSAAQAMTSALGLRGLNSLDCMVDGEKWWVLEINARLSATFALYDDGDAGARLFDAHLHACAGHMVSVPIQERALAHLIYYAPVNFRVPATMQWPSWAVDLPLANTLVPVNEPVCTITAGAPRADDALALARARMDKLAAVLA